jgi:hypothetical protein
VSAEAAEKAEQDRLAELRDLEAECCPTCGATRGWVKLSIYEATAQRAMRYFRRIRAMTGAHAQETP